MRRLTFAAVLIGTLIAPSGAALATAPENTDLLVSATPRIDAVLTSAPSVIQLGFAESIDPKSAEVQLFSSNGEPVHVGSAVVDGANLESSNELLDDGRYLVAWSVDGTDAGPASGGYFFTVDAAGLGTIGVDRQVESASGIRGSLRSVAVAIAFIAGVLLIASLTTTALDPRSRVASFVVPAAAAAAGAALIALATYALPAGASVGDFVDLESWRAGLNSTAGRAWLAVFLSLGAIPLLVLLQRDDTGAPRGTRWRLGAVFVGVVVLVGVSAGIGALVNPGPASVALGFLVGVGGAIAWFQDQRVIALFALAGFVTVALVSMYTTRPVGHSDVVAAGALVFEIDVEPAVRGINEMHLYGFESGGGSAVLSESKAWITHTGTGAGPIEVPLVRAGPNHYLTYTADMPMKGEWRVEFATGRSDGDGSTVDTIVNIR